MLDLGDDDAPRFLKQGLVVPSRIQLLQPSGDAVMLAQHDGVHDGQLRVLVGSVVAGVEARPSRAPAPVGQQLAIDVDPSGAQPAVFVRAHQLSHAVDAAVNSRSVEPLSDLIQLQT